MLKSMMATLARLAPALALFSCAAPKAIVVDEPAPASKTEAVVKAPEPDVPAPSAPADGIRLPDMMTMPGDDEFRATNLNQASAPPDTGAVIARPPTEPAAQPKE